MNDTKITIVGNVVDEPRLRETRSGVKVASFRIASTSRRFDILHFATGIIYLERWPL